MRQFTRSLHHRPHLHIFGLDDRRVLLVLLAKIVSTRKNADQSHDTRVYCDRVTHRSWECDSVTSPAERRRILQSKRLCFNCTGTQHNASQCRSRTSCVRCKQRHHSSICDRSTTAGRQTTTNGGVALTATQEGEKVCHPVVLVKLNGVTCTGATASYASGYILDRLNLYRHAL